jgi:hypothetical protein
MGFFNGLHSGAPAAAAGRAAARSSAPNRWAHLCRPQHRPCPRLARPEGHPTRSAEHQPERQPAVGRPRLQVPALQRETEVRRGAGLLPAHPPCPRLRHPRAHTLHRLHRPHRLLRQRLAQRLRLPTRTCMRRRPFSAELLLRPGSALSRHRTVQCQRQL